MANNTTVQGQKMHASFNNVAMLVNLTKDARFNQKSAQNADGTAYDTSDLYFTGASNEGFAGRDGKESVSFIEFHIRGRYATSLAQHMTRGTRVLIEEARLHTWSTKKEDGTYDNGYLVEVTRLSIISHPQTQQGQQAPVQQAQPQYQQAPVQQQPQYQAQDLWANIPGLDENMFGDFQ